MAVLIFQVYSHRLVQTTVEMHFHIFITSILSDSTLRLRFFLHKIENWFFRGGRLRRASCINIMIKRPQKCGLGNEIPSWWKRLHFFHRFSVSRKGTDNIREEVLLDTINARIRFGNGESTSTRRNMVACMLSRKPGTEHRATFAPNQREGKRHDLFRGRVMPAWTSAGRPLPEINATQDKSRWVLECTIIKVENRFPMTSCIRCFLWKNKRTPDLTCSLIKRGYDENKTRPRPGNFRVSAGVE